MRHPVHVRVYDNTLIFNNHGAISRPQAARVGLYFKLSYYQLSPATNECTIDRRYTSILYIYAYRFSRLHNTPPSEYGLISI